MPFDINNLNPTEKFYIPGTDEKEWVALRMCTSEVLERIDAETMETCVEWRHPLKKDGKPDLRKPLQRIEYAKVKNEKLRTELMWDWMIAEWAITDPQGQWIPCTKENKLKLMRGAANFAMFISECLERLTEGRRKTEEDLEKN